MMGTNLGLSGLIMGPSLGLSRVHVLFENEHIIMLNVAPLKSPDVKPTAANFASIALFQCQPLSVESCRSVF
jgi:hypothetical protein